MNMARTTVIDIIVALTLLYFPQPFCLPDINDCPQHVQVLTELLLAEESFGSSFLSSDIGVAFRRSPPCWFNAEAAPPSALRSKYENRGRLLGVGGSLFSSWRWHIHKVGGQICSNRSGVSTYNLSINRKYIKHAWRTYLVHMIGGNLGHSLEELMQNRPKAGMG